MTATLRVSRIHFPVNALGPGLRLGIWVQGCDLGCPGCMARDTWDPDGGRDLPVDRLVEVWRQAYRRGARGLTISGGEPSRQASALAELMDEVRAVAREEAADTDQDRCVGDEFPSSVDVLVFTGLDGPQFAATAPHLRARADAVVLGRFDITRPTDLLWRGSGNQELVPLTPLGHQRFDRYIAQTSEAPLMQFAVDDQGLWLVGVPRIGDLPELERHLRDNGITLGDVSWRP
jgi:anaerobic ribonucleoside-triphosphate reductase activating protein